MTYNDTDFYLQQKESERAWNKPIALALAFHVIIFAFSMYLPEILDRKPILDEIVTVNLVSLPEVQTSTPAQKTPPQKVQETKPAEIKKVDPAKAKVQIPKVEEPLPEKLQPIKPVSLKPLKRKVRKTDPKKLANERIRKQRAKEKQRDLARLMRAEAEAKEEARMAREALASLLIQKGTQKNSSTSRKSSGRKDSNLSVPFMNYVAALQGQVQQYWVLPDMKQWDARLETVVVLYIRRNGTVAKTIIEKKSKDPFFDQFVMKTIDKAQPLPRIPNLIKEVPLEVGFRFRPGGLVSM